MTDGSGNYGNKERCEVIARRPLVINTTQYDVEGGGYDYLTVNGYQYKYSPPNGVAMRGGAALKWYSDKSGNGAGWKVCAEDKMGRYIQHPHTRTHTVHNAQRLYTHAPQ